VAETMKDLRQAEEELRCFQETHKAVSLQEQARSAVEGAALLKGQILASQVQLEAMRNYANEENAEVVRRKRQDEEMKRQLADMQYGEGLRLPEGQADGEKGRPELQVAFAELPELVLELARRMRDVKVQETVYTLLTQQLEEAKIQEAR